MSRNNDKTYHDYYDIVVSYDSIRIAPLDEYTKFLMKTKWEALDYVSFFCLWNDPVFKRFTHFVS